MSTINVQCTDQVLAITNSPVIASGGANENYIQFNFCQLWTGYAKVAVFYQQRGTYYYSLVDATDKCVIPAECCTSEGKIHFGVVGSLDNVTRTSEVLTYRIVEGVFTEIDDPTPAIYQQILSELAAIREELETHTMPIKDLTAETTISDSDAFPFYDASADANRKTLWSNIVSKIRTALFSNINGILKANGSGAISEATVDSAPTANSTNLVTSGGVKTALDAITPASIGASRASSAYTETLASASWNGSSAPYTYTINNANVSATSAVEVLPGLSITAEQLEALQNANIQDGGQSSGHFVLKAFGEKPIVNIPIRFIVRGDL